jgi:DNA-binding NarL/FixJ family response regulator
MKLMIVDDHAAVRRMIRQMVATSGDSVRECSSGDEAVRMAAGFCPDFVTMDVRMPGLSGLDATRAIVAARSDVRIVIVTNYDQPDLRDAATASGAIGLVLKENLDQVRPLLLSHTAATSQSQAVPTTNDSVLRVLMAEDSQLDCELICLRLTECGYTPVVELVCCEDEMRAALERSQWDIVFTDHGLPGFSGVAALGLLRKMRLQTPGLCVTGSADPIAIGRMLEAGAFACVNKDDLSTLCATVERALNKKSSVAPPSSQAKNERTDSNAPAASDSPRDPDRSDGSESPTGHP